MRVASTWPTAHNLGFTSLIFRNVLAGEMPGEQAGMRERQPIFFFLSIHFTFKNASHMGNFSRNALGGFSMKPMFFGARLG